MENILLNLGVEHEDEAGMQRKVQELVEEAQTNTVSKNLTQIGNANDLQKRSKKSMLESIMEGANAANDSSLTRSSHITSKIGNIEERVKFISNIADIPNIKEKEQRFNSGKRGYYDASTSLNIFSSSQSGQSNEYRSSTNIDDSLLKTIMHDAKKQRLKPNQNNLESKCSTATEDSLIDVNMVDTTFAEPIVSTIYSLDGDNDSYNDAPYTTDVAPSPVVDKIAHTSTTNSEDLLVCPFCNRDLGHLSTGSLLVEQHIERCARRGSRNVANYAVQGQEDEEAPPTIATRTTRGRRSTSSNNTSGTSASSLLPDSNQHLGNLVEEEEVFFSEDEWNSEPEEHSKKNRSGKGEPPAKRVSLRRNNVSMNSLTSQNSSSSQSKRKTTNNTRSTTTSSSSGRKTSAEVTVAEIQPDDDDTNSECSNDWVGSVASIVDDWEDEVYLARLESIQREIKKENKKKKKERNNTAAIHQDHTVEIESEYMRTDYGVEVLRRTWERLHEYQQEGCRWLYRLYDEGVGGILGDEMGK